MLRCEYCGQEWQDGQRCCWACGAPAPKGVSLEEKAKGTPEWWEKMAKWRYLDDGAIITLWGIEYPQR